MRAELITIGDEILIGQTVDTNSAWMAKNLNELGIFVYQITSISDTREHILQALADAASRVELVLITGGLGPTNDDITKATLCEYFSTHLVRNEGVEEKIKTMFGQRGIPILDVNLQQADLPANCQVIENKRGTAQGMWFEYKGVVYASMPGVPFEMEGIMKDHLLEKIRLHFETPHILHFHILTQGIGESMLANRIADWEASLAEVDIKLAYLPSFGAVKLRLTTSGPDEKLLKKHVDQKVSEFMKIAGEVVYGFNDESLEATVGELLQERKATLSTAESCTGGRIASAITSIHGSSAYFLGSVVSYANDVKVNLLQVDDNAIHAHGAVSEAVVIQMANGVKEKLNSTYSIAVSGIAGPDGGSEEKPVGTVWIAIAGPNETVAEKFLFRGDRKRILQRTSQMGLSMARNEILRQQPL
ncbi:MAG: competence/damage-inducible protein A [Cryomorphaceae bacterium]|nr:competence/damage-inducible protein A [Cryomorphaceae bacterium]